MIEQIINHCLTLEPITNALGNDPMKIFPFDVPRKIKTSSGRIVTVKMPHMLIEPQTGSDVEDLQGRTGTVELWYTITVASLSGRQSNQIYLAVKNAIGHAIGEIWDGIPVQRTNLGFPGLPDEPATDGSDDSTFYAMGTLYVLADWNGS